MKLINPLIKYGISVILIIVISPLITSFTNSRLILNLVIILIIGYGKKHLKRIESEEKNNTFHLNKIIFFSIIILFAVINFYYALLPKSFSQIIGKDLRKNQNLKLKITYRNKFLDELNEGKVILINNQRKIINLLNYLEKLKLNNFFLKKTRFKNKKAISIIISTPHKEEVSLLIFEESKKVYLNFADKRKEFEIHNEKKELNFLMKYFKKIK